MDEDLNTIRLTCPVCSNRLSFVKSTQIDEVNLRCNCCSTLLRIFLKTGTVAWFRLHVDDIKYWQE